MLSSKISARDVDPSLINDLGGATKSYVDQQVINISQTGIPKLMVYPFSIVAETEGQTVFEIPLDTFDANTDTVFVQSGRTMISPNEDFSVVDNSVVLTEGVPVERVITIYVFKNVPIGEDGSVSGSVIMPGSLTLDRLSVMPTAEQVGALPLTGGTISNQLNIKPNGSNTQTSVIHYQGTSFLRSIDDEGNFADIYHSLEIPPRYQKRANNVTNTYDLFGTHNKPYGSYTGNGSATARTINTGGIGNELLIWNANGCAIVTRTGAITINGGTVKGVTYSEAHYLDGVLTLATTNNILNASGTNSYYECK